MTPRVSIVMPVFNGAATVEEAVRSALAQSVGELELVVVDDGSQDGTAERVRAIADPRILLLENGRNCGVSFARNRGMQAARGRYVAFLDADDTCSPLRLERQLRAFAEEPELVFCTTDAEFIDEATGERLLWQAQTRDEVLRYQISAHASLVYASMMIDRTRVPPPDFRFSTDARFAEDFEWALRMSGHGRIANLPEPLYRYHRRRSSASNRHHRERLEERCQVIRAHFAARGLDMTMREAEVHSVQYEVVNPKFRFRSTLDQLYFLVDYHRWANRLLAVNGQLALFPDGVLAECLILTFRRIVERHYAIGELAALADKLCSVWGGTVHLARNELLTFEGRNPI